ncbi:cytochrome P450 [Dactylonectria macrodidyma]|uniref:Cytochrome P450 n=1 Tax=Dactylonectria macrodidyma TaxID=307937 RepID=A0A9P9FSR7_9HYPO|nr:cytochrome P450 [Dactylonectria macrodidyma]
MTRLRHIPGPFFAGCTRLWKLNHVRRGEMEKVQMRLHARYGPVVRIAPNEVLISDPSAVKSIYGHTSNFGKTKFYIPFGTKDNDDLFTDPNIARHAHQRREIASAYSMTSLVELEPFVDECTRIMCERLRDLFAQSRTPVDLASWLQYYAFDVIGQITFSQPFGFMSEGMDVQDCIAKLERYLVHGALFTVMPEYWSLYYVGMMLLSKIGLAYPPGLGVFNEFVGNQIQSRLQRGDEGRADFVSRLQKMGRTEPTIWRSCFANVAAGSDTTAISLRSIMYFLLRSPQTYKRLQEEIASFDAQGKISDPVTFGETINMPYLQAVMKEAMRVHPAVQWSLPRYVPPSNLQLNSFTIPAGAEVGVNPYVIHRNKLIFGDDADQFRPERWLENKDKARDMDRYMIQFGMGSRICLGKNISLMEMAKLLPQLLRNFDFELVDPKAEWKVSNFWFAKQIDMDCYIAERK